MNNFFGVLLAVSVMFVTYTYLLYPLALLAVAPFRRQRYRWASPEELPTISITLPAYNEEATIREAIEGLLKLDYPANKRQILIVSDASTDRTDEIIAEYADRGVELLRMPERVGKTAAENVAAGHLTGEVVVNTDASIRIRRDALRRLVAPFQDSDVGLASGRLVSVAKSDMGSNLGDKGYYSYEMWVRALETRVSSIAQAAGGFYAIRRHLHQTPCPAELTRDTASLVAAFDKGYRSVAADDAICYVPWQESLRKEFRRKTRTFTRGLGTLWYKRHALNPFRYGLFSWVFFSHKLCRWLVPWWMLGGSLALVGLSVANIWARWALAGAVAVAGLQAVGWLWPEDARAPRLLSIPAYIGFTNVAVLRAWLNVARGNTKPRWEPTRRR